ncbi:hypothetical protein LNP25_30805 [Klebsiella variicola subsp. variicola]|nr:hypothetical protein [Klebsiella variicola subsp. variicola]
MRRFCRPVWRKKAVGRVERGERFYRPQRRQFLIAIALLPVKLRPLRLLAAP